MGKVRIVDIKLRLAFYSKVLLGFSAALTPQAFLLIVIYFGEYLLVKYSKGLNASENVIGATIVGEVSEDEVYSDVVNFRNCIVHYDPVKLQKYIDVFESIDYTELCPINRDSIIRHCFNIFAMVDWNVVRSFVLMEV